MAKYFSGEWQIRRKNHENTSRFISLGKKIQLFDIGSTGGTPPPFCWILEGVDLINFEPDPRAESEDTGDTLPIAIGPTHLNTIYLNRRPTTSSLLRPFHQIIDRYNFELIFHNNDNIFETVAEQLVNTYGFDEIIKQKRLPSPDFVKIDVQGLTFEVLESAEEALKNSVIGILTEVEFLETYTGQKTFGAVHEFLYTRGFEVFRISNVNKWYYKTSLPLKKLTGQDVFCDFLYLKRIDSLDDQMEFWDEAKIIKIILISLLFDLTDTAAAFLEKAFKNNILKKETNEKLAEIISEWDNALDFLYHPLPATKTSPPPSQPPSRPNLDKPSVKPNRELSWFDISRQIYHKSVPLGMRLKLRNVRRALLRAN